MAQNVFGIGTLGLPTVATKLNSGMKFLDVITDTNGYYYTVVSWLQGSILNSGKYITAVSGDFVLVKYDSVGNVIWTYQITEFGGTLAAPSFFKVYGDSIYLVGDLTLIAPVRRGIYILKVTTSGVRVWHNHFIYQLDPDKNPYEVQPTAVFNTATNKLYISGTYRSDNPVPFSNVTLPATSTDRGVIFCIDGTTGGTTNSDTFVFGVQTVIKSITMDASANIYACGGYSTSTDYTIGSTTLPAANTAFIIKFDQSLAALSSYTAPFTVDRGYTTKVLFMNNNIYFLAHYRSQNTITLSGSITLAGHPFLPMASLLQLDNSLQLQNAVNVGNIANNLYTSSNCIFIAGATASSNVSIDIKKYDATLQIAGSLHIQTLSFAEAGILPYPNVSTSPNYIYVCGGTSNTVAKYSQNFDLVYSKTLPSAFTNSISTATDGDVTIFNNFTSNIDVNLDSMKTYTSTAGYTISYITKYIEPRAEIYYDNAKRVVKFTKQPYTIIRGAGNQNGSLGNSFIIRSYTTDTTHTAKGFFRSLNWTGAGAASSLLYPLGAGINAIHVSYVINNVEVNISEPIYVNNLSYYLSSSSGNLDTSTPALLKWAVQYGISDPNKASYTFSTGGNSMTSRLITRVTALNNYQSGGEDIHSDGLQTLKRITIADPNVFGIESLTTSYTSPTSTTISYKLTKVDSNGNLIQSDVTNPATFDTIIATVPKPANGIIRIDRTVDSTTTPNVASINISSGATTTTWSGQVITILSSTDTTVTVSYKGPFTENTFSMDTIVTQDVTATYVEPPTNDYIPCLPTGTQVLTPTGYRVVEALRDGDAVVTAAGKTVPIRTYSKHIAVATEKTAPYLIPAKTFGPSQKATICLSPLHAVSIGKGLWEIPMYAAARYPGIRQYGLGEQVTYYHIETPNFFQDNLVIEGGVVVEAFAGRQCDGLKKLYTFDCKRGAFTRASPPSAAVVAKRG